MIELAKAALKEAESMAKKEGIEIETVVKMGDPAVIINEMSGNYDQIVMGTKGLTGLPHLLIGSVAEKVVRGSKCSVTVIK